MAATPESSWPSVKALLHSVYEQPDATRVHAHFDRVLDALVGKLPAVAGQLGEARADILSPSRPRRWPTVPIPTLPA